MCIHKTLIGNFRLAVLLLLGLSAPANADDAEGDAIRARRAKGFNFSLAMVKPAFNLKYYEKLYGEPEFYPTLSSDWMFLRSTVSLGLRFKIGYFDTNGNAAKSPQVDSPSEDELTKDIDKTSLTMLPLDMALVSRVGIGASRIVVLSGWVGYQDTYYQEVRSNAVTDEAESNTSDDTDRTLTSGWNGGLILGLGADIKISQFGSANASSLRSLGIGAIYVTPYVEIVQVLGASLLGSAGKTDFSRSALGIGFLFEGV